MPVAAVERPGAWASLRRSADLTRGARGTVFAVSALTLALVLVPFFLPRAGWLGDLAAILATGYGAVACAVGYHDLRAMREADVVEVFA
jgi:hypothetical protein